jgi:hypothetical protein
MRHPERERRTLRLLSGPSVEAKDRQNLMATKEAIKAANEIVYESWRSDVDGDLYCNEEYKLKDRPALRDAVAEAMDKFKRS